MNLKGARVLVVEDEAIVCMMIEDFLGDFGCEVVATAANLDDALSSAEALALDVAVLDVNLAGKLSYPVADKLRARNIPFLFATGYGAAGLRPGLEGVPVLSKPFGLEQLAQGLALALSSPRSGVLPGK